MANYCNVSPNARRPIEAGTLDGRVDFIQRRPHHHNRRDAADDVRDSAGFLGAEVAAQHALLAVGDPLFDDGVAAQHVIPHAPTARSAPRTYRARKRSLASGIRTCMKPALFGAHSEVAEHYGVDPEVHEPHATTLDYVVAAAAG